MRLHITGANGYIGKALVKAGAIPLNCDVTDYDSIVEEVDRKRPKLVLHLASKSDVDYCQIVNNAKEVSTINVIGTRFLAEVLNERGIRGVLLSSSQIWKGGMSEYAPHREDSKPSPPVNYYGITKVAAEFLALESGMKVIRTSYLFDKDRLIPKISDLEMGIKLTEPVFIKRSFLHLDHFVEMIDWYSRFHFSIPNIIHLSGSRTVSWFEFMQTLAKMYGLGKEMVKPRLYGKGYVPRPMNGGLDVSLSNSLGCPQYNYIEGIRKMRDES